LLTGLHKTGCVDLEAVEMLVRSAMHQAGARALTELLHFPVPDERTIPCPCGDQARYRELRSKAVLTAVGMVEITRPYYLCPGCHQGQFPADEELDVVDTEFSPGVRRMQALVGQDAAFEHGREQMKLLAGLEVTTKCVERVAESIGGDIVRCEQEEIDRAVQLDLPIIVGEPVPILYVLMDGTGVGGRIGIPNRKALFIPGRLCEHTAELCPAGMRGLTVELAFPADGFFLHHRHTGAVHQHVQDGNGLALSLIHI